MPRPPDEPSPRGPRAWATTRQLPIIVHTSSALPSDIEACYRWGANGYVVKPIGFDDFARQIGVILAYWLETNDVER